jgi:hypothetical protein
MCLSKGKIKVELELTPDELIELGKFLKKKVATVNTLTAKDEGGESGKGNN